MIEQEMGFFLFLSIFEKVVLFYKMPLPMEEFRLCMGGYVWVAMYGWICMGGYVWVAMYGWICMGGYVWVAMYGWLWTY